MVCTLRRVRRLLVRLGALDCIGIEDLLKPEVLGLGFLGSVRNMLLWKEMPSYDLPTTRTAETLESNSISTPFHASRNVLCLARSTQDTNLSAPARSCSTNTLYEGAVSLLIWKMVYLSTFPSRSNTFQCCLGRPPTVYEHGGMHEG